MSTASQIPRSSIVWLLVAQFTVIAPHALRMSWWMIAIWLLCALWRVAMYRGSASYPSVWLRTLLVIMGCAGIIISYGHGGVLELAVALLILAFSMKLIEVKKRRDLYLVFYLAFFIVAASFLFSQSLFLALYHIVSVILITAAMVATQRSLTGGSAFASIRVATTLVAQAVPIMLVFFLVFPRIAPLWAMPKNEVNATTGMSADISPGDISKLVQSDQEVFRATFSNAVVSRHLLYWRGMTLSHFDGRRWSQNKPQKNRANTAKHFNPLLFDSPVSYQIQMEASKQHWLFLLPIATITQTLDYKPLAVNATQGFTLQSASKINDKRVFQVDSFLNYQAEPNLSTARFNLETQLPKGYNPKTRELALQLRQQNRNSQQVVEKLLAMFGQEKFSYTLEPPKLGRHSVDDFMFATQSGFCEHYANAFAFTLRAAGIPARIVIGYQGGVIDPNNNSVIVRQKDAHAWAEYWQQGKGWQRVDPTAAVSPDRVMLGADASFEIEDTSDGFTLLATQLGFVNSSLFKALSQNLNALNNHWKIWIVGFDNDSQLLVLENLLGEVTPFRAGLLVMAVLGLVLAAVSFQYILRRGGNADRPEKTLYNQFCKKVEVLGVYRKTSEPAGDFALRLVAAHPAYASEINGITRYFELLSYQEVRTPIICKEMQRRVKAFAPVA